jgi:FkbM family methyltransferase
MKKIIYYILTFGIRMEHKLEDKILNILKKGKKLTVFDVGCYRGVFTEKIIKMFGGKANKFYLFDVNKNVKKYISNLLKLNNVHYNEVALHNKNGKAVYNFNTSFECSGSSISTLVSNDIYWNISRKIILKILFLNSKGFIKYKVPTITLDSFVKKNKINCIDILKIDIDGSEHLMLKGANETLKKNKIKTILIEIGSLKKNFNKKERNISQLLKKNNFTFLKKDIYLSPSLFSNIKAGDYQFINNKYL